VDGGLVELRPGEFVEGQDLVASTSGTDSDWVVKVIDFFPDEVAGQPALGGYQLMVSADIFRGRYREGRAAGRRRTQLADASSMMQNDS
jgi:hypothetical protein